MAGGMAGKQYSTLSARCHDGKSLIAGWAFSATAATVVSGAMAERTKFRWVGVGQA
jgi:ammonia channel protein AmtB